MAALSKDQVKIMKRCIGFKFKTIFQTKFIAKRNYFSYFWCNGIEEIKHWNDLCKQRLACFRQPEKTVPYYFLTNRGINKLEMYLGIQIKFKE